PRADLRIWRCLRLSGTIRPATPRRCWPSRRRARPCARPWRELAPPARLDPLQTSAAGMTPYESCVRGALRAYKLTLSPLIGRQCRYLPTCSEYAAEALIGHGPWRGSYLAARRLCRCHPWGGSGYDPPPPPRKAAKEAVPAPAQTWTCET